MKYTHQVVTTENSSSEKKLINIEKKIPEFPLDLKVIDKLFYV